MKEHRSCAGCSAGRLNNQFDYELTDANGVVREFCGVDCLLTWTQDTWTAARELFLAPFQLAGESDE
jgi:hypothetical protein